MNVPWLRIGLLAPGGMNSMSPWPSNSSAPFWSITIRLSIRLCTRKLMRVGMFDLIRPVTTVAAGRCVARIRWMPTARDFCANRTMNAFHFFAAGHHQVGQLIDDDHDVRQMLGDLRFLFRRAGLEAFDQLFLRHRVVFFDVSHAGLGKKFVSLIHLFAGPFQHAGGPARVVDDRAHQMRNVLERSHFHDLRDRPGSASPGRAAAGT